MEEPVYGQVEIKGTTTSPQVAVLDMVNMKGEQVAPKAPETKPALPRELAGMVEPELTRETFKRIIRPGEPIPPGFREGSVTEEGMVVLRKPKPGEAIPTGFRRAETGEVEMVDVGLGFRVPVLKTAFAV